MISGKVFSRFLLLIVFIQIGLLLAACGDTATSVPSTSAVSAATAQPTTAATTAIPATTSVAVTTSAPVTTSAATTAVPATTVATTPPTTTLAPATTISVLEGSSPVNTTSPSATTTAPATPKATVAPEITKSSVGGNSFNDLSDWWNVWHDASNTNYNPNEKILNASNINLVIRKWARDTLSPYALVWNNFVISRNRSGQLQAYEIEAGKPAATYGTSKDGTFAILGTGLLYTTEEDGNFLAAYDLLGGSQAFRTKAAQSSAGSQVSVVVQANSLVLTGTSREGGNASAYNGQEGKLKWSAKTSEPSYAGTNWVVAGNLAILNSVPQAIAYDMNTGREVWRKDLAAGLSRQMLAANNTLVTYKTNGGVTPAEFNAYDAQTGNLKWSKTFDNTSSGGILASNGSQLFLETNSETSSAVYALELATGKELWRKSFQGLIPRAATLTNDLLFFASGSSIYAVQTSDGKTLQKLGVQWVVEYVTQIIVSEGQLVITGSDIKNNYTTFVLSLG